MGRHGRPEPDALAGVDVAADLESGPVIDVAPSAQKASTAKRRPGRMRAIGIAMLPTQPRSRLTGGRAAGDCGSRGPSRDARDTGRRDGHRPP